MPAAGTDSDERERAHMQWAQRYNKRGDVSRALAHFGRALEYSDMASFGGLPRSEPSASTTRPLIAAQARPPGVRHTDAFKREYLAKLAVCKVCRKEGVVHRVLYWYLDTDNDEFSQLCQECAVRVKESGVSIELVRPYDKVDDLGVELTGAVSVGAESMLS